MSNERRSPYYQRPDGSLARRYGRHGRNKLKKTAYGQRMARKAKSNPGVGWGYLGAGAAIGAIGLGVAAGLLAKDYAANAGAGAGVGLALGGVAGAIMGGGFKTLAIGVAGGIALVYASALAGMSSTSANGV
jgi:hypothetical protein